jgi:hypothetical protein
MSHVVFNAEVDLSACCMAMQEEGCTRYILGLLDFRVPGPLNDSIIHSSGALSVLATHGIGVRCWLDDKNVNCFISQLVRKLAIHILIKIAFPHEFVTRMLRIR